MKFNLNLYLYAFFSGSKVKDVQSLFRKKSKHNGESDPLLSDRSNAVTPSSSDGEMANVLGYGNCPYISRKRLSTGSIDSDGHDNVEKDRGNLLSDSVGAK